MDPKKIFQELCDFLFAANLEEEPTKGRFVGHKDLTEKEKQLRDEKLAFIQILENLREKAEKETLTPKDIVFFEAEFVKHIDKLKEHGDAPYLTKIKEFFNRKFIEIKQTGIADKKQHDNVLVLLARAFLSIFKKIPAFLQLRSSEHEIGERLKGPAPSEKYEPASIIEGTAAAKALIWNLRRLLVQASIKDESKGLKHDGFVNLISTLDGLYEKPRGFTPKDYNSFVEAFDTFCSFAQSHGYDPNPYKESLIEFFKIYIPEEFGVKEGTKLVGAKVFNVLDLAEKFEKKFKTQIPILEKMQCLDDFEAFNQKLIHTLAEMEQELARLQADATKTTAQLTTKWQKQLSGLSQEHEVLFQKIRTLRKSLPEEDRLFINSLEKTARESINNMQRIFIELSMLPKESHKKTPIVPLKTV